MDLFLQFADTLASAGKAIDAHPVLLPLGDHSLLSAARKLQTKFAALDIVGAQVYRGFSFGAFFREYYNTTNRPLLMSEVRDHFFLSPYKFIWYH